MDWTDRGVRLTETFNAGFLFVSLFLLEQGDRDATCSTASSGESIVGVLRGINLRRFVDTGVKGKNTRFTIAGVFWMNDGFPCSQF